MLELSDLCICLERLVAVGRGDFFCLAEKGGWAFVDGPFRSRTMRGVLNETEDHTGEPYLYHACPFCGAVLPIYNTEWQSHDEG